MTPFTVTPNSTVERTCFARRSPRALGEKLAVRVGSLQVGQSTKVAEGAECTCSVCGRVYYMNRRRGHSATRCNSCIRNSHWREHRSRMIAYLGGRCSRCGYDRCEAALQFHHRDPETKAAFPLNSSHNRRWEIVRGELDKCVLLCANCHAELHSDNDELRKRTGAGRPRHAGDGPEAT